MRCARYHRYHSFAIIKRNKKWKEQTNAQQINPNPPSASHRRRRMYHLRDTLYPFAPSKQGSKRTLCLRDICMNNKRCNLNNRCALSAMNVRICMFLSNSLTNGSNRRLRGTAWHLYVSSVVCHDYSCVCQHHLPPFCRRNKTFGSFPNIIVRNVCVCMLLLAVHLDRVHRKHSQLI